MKTKAFFALILLLSIAGCGTRKKVEQQKPAKKEVFTEVDIPVATEQVRNFFDEDVDGFTFDDQTSVDASQAAVSEQLYDDADLSWKEVDQEKTFRTVYFDFDSDRIRPDQEDALEYDISLVRDQIRKHEESGNRSPITIVVEGHSCHSAGSSVYNLALSERRAKKLKDRMVMAGIPQEYIKIVGRGQEMPAIVNGAPVNGDRAAQWPNRRDEIRVIYA